MSRSSTDRTQTKRPLPDWAEPGAYQVAPGVHRIPLPLPSDALVAVNVYVLESDDGLVLIDGGWAITAARDCLDESLRAIGHHPRDIMTFLVTHSHRDHYTQAVALRREFRRARIVLGVGERASLSLVARGKPPRGTQARQLREAGADDLALAWSDRETGARDDLMEWELPDEWLEGRRQIVVGNRTLDAIPTPGHTRGHFVFADHAASILFAGDHVLPTITPSIGYEGVPAQLPLGDYLRSLADVRALPDLELLPAHGGVGHRSHARIDELIHHHDSRLALCLRVVRASGTTAREVAAQISWTRHDRHLDELGKMDSGLAVLETMAHLDVLAARGAIGRSTIDGVHHYALPPAGPALPM
ncbi:MBL fold metallo-hydrolase [Rhodococcus koreensis]|uniref:MBL fold metallo-hydrolase n=1 Tax=Rhodococcus koreensis TaxID=99653 RepID=UPI0036710587